MKIDHGQKMFASSVAGALARAWTERLGLRVVVDPRGGTSTAELTDDTGRVVWSQTAAGVQLELPLAPAPPDPDPPRLAPKAPQTPKASAARDDAEALVRLSVPAPAIDRPEEWAEDNDLDHVTRGLVRWRYAVPVKGDVAVAYCDVPPLVAEELVNTLAESGVTAAPEPSPPGARCSLLDREGGKVLVADGDTDVTWTTVSVGVAHTLLTRDGDTLDVHTPDVWFDESGFFLLGGRGAARRTAKKAAKAKGKRP